MIVPDPAGPSGHGPETRYTDLEELELHRKVEGGLVRYPENVLSRLRYRYCPMCRAELIQGTLNDDGILRVLCPACGWVHYPASAIGINVVAMQADKVVVLFPRGEPAETPIALPGGHAEYGESPERAAEREVLEETGLGVQVTHCLGWQFADNREYPGPMLNFFFEAEVIGGTIKDSQEGMVRMVPLDKLPPISPDRHGSYKALDLFLRKHGRL